MHLVDGTLWPMPIVLHAATHQIDTILQQQIKMVTLRDKYYLPIAMLEIEDIFDICFAKEAEMVLGVDLSEVSHPYLKYMLGCKVGCKYIGGKISKIQDPVYYNYKELRLTPSDCLDFFAKQGWRTIVAFQTRNPMHRSHVEITKKALQQTGDAEAKLFLHPTVGVTQECDVPADVRIKCYQSVLTHYTPHSVKLSLLPLSMRMAGPREALWHALIRQNFGCTHFIIGRDHAGPSFKRKDGSSFYAPYEAQELVLNLPVHLKNQLKIKILTSEMMVYVKELNSYLPTNELPLGVTTLMQISGTEQRKLLSQGKEIPEWFTYPNIVDELKKAYPLSIDQGFCVYFIGLSGCGKTTMANILNQRLQEIVTNGRKITVLDGDVVRAYLSKGLGFSRSDRSVNVRRIGYVASEIVKHRGIVICANINPYQEDRNHNRSLIGEDNFIEVYVNTPLDACEKRDVKGLYKSAREGQLKEFTGVSDPFEPPLNSNLEIDGSNIDDISKNIDKIISYLVLKGLIQ